MKQTLREIAKALDLSPATVSKSLSGRPEVSESTRARVSDYAREIGYVPPTGRAQAARVAIMIQDDNHVDLNTAFFYDVLIGFKHYAKRCNFEVIILSISAEEQTECTYDEYIAKNQLGGVFVMGLKTSDPYYTQLSVTTVKTVTLDIPSANIAVGSVETDNIKGVRLAIEHLAKLGHKKIGFINGHSKAYVSQDRLSGYMAAMCNAGLSYDPQMVFEGGYVESGGAAGADYFINKGTTAIFCASDLMAIGAMRRFEELDVNVPDSISIVGFDNAPFGAVCSTPLTTIAQDRPRIGMTACALLDCLMRGVPVNRVVLPPSLLVRASTKKPLVFS